MEKNPLQDILKFLNEFDAQGWRPLSDITYKNIRIVSFRKIEPPDLRELPPTDPNTLSVRVSETVGVTEQIL